MSESTNPSPEAIGEMKRMINGYSRTALIYAAAKLGFADILRDGPKSHEELANKTGANSENIQRILRRLEDFRVFRETADGKFENTELSTTLRSEVDGSVLPLIMRTGVEWWYRPWGDILHTIESGEAAFDKHYGVDFWQYLSEHPDAENAFNANRSQSAMAGENQSILEACDFTGVRSFVDVGAGYGGFTALILKENPEIRGTWFDLPHSEPGARKLMEEHGVADRCDFRPGSFFEKIPSEHDLYIIKNIIHDWNDERTVAIYTTCRAAMKPGDRLMVVDGVLSKDSPSFLRAADLTMMVMLGGKYDDRDGYERLLGRSGFKMRGITETGSEVASIVEAVAI